MRRRLLMLAVILAGLSGRVGAADSAVPFAVGERLTYDVSWNNMLTAGQASIVVRDRRDTGSGRAAYYIVGEARPSSLLERLYHLYYKAETFLDTATLQPTHATMYSDERGRTRLRSMKFLPGNLADYEVKSATLVRSQVKVPTASQDPLSIMYFLRTLPLKEGATFNAPIVTNGKSYRLSLRVGGRESVKTAAGTFSAWKVTPTITDERSQPTTTRNLTIWLSADARRLPLWLKADLAVGSVELRLASVGAAPANRASAR